MPPLPKQKNTESAKQVGKARELLINHIQSIYSLWEVMLYPNDARLREEHEIVLFSKNVFKMKNDALSNQPTIENEQRELENLQRFCGESLLRQPSLDEVDTREAEAGRKGAIVGDVLLFLAEMVETGVPEPSLRKAFFVAGDYHAKVPFGHGSHTGTSEPILRQLWKEYKTVAHFWAAFRLCQFSGDSKFWDPEKMVFGSAFPNFLAMSEWFRKFGIHFRATRHKNGSNLLDDSDQWVLSEGCQLPHLSLTITELPGWMVDCLKRYKRNYDPYR